MSLPASAAAGDHGRVEGAAWRSLVDAASAPYRRSGRFAWHFARGKLALDPVFRHLLREGLVPAGARVLDIGCGQGLLASLLRSAGGCTARGDWPRDWAPAPRGVSITGIDLMPKDIARAQAAIGADARFVCADMRKAPFPANDVTVILDVLHYIPVPEQDAVLARVRAALQPQGRLLLRVGDALSRRRFVTSQWVDRVVTLVRGHRAAPQFGRPLAEWMAALRGLGFEVQSLPMSQGTPFANVLLLARLDRPAAPGDAADETVDAAGGAAGDAAGDAAGGAAGDAAGGAAGDAAGGAAGDAAGDAAGGAAGDAAGGRARRSAGGATAGADSVCLPAAGRAGVFKAAAAYRRRPEASP